MRYKLSITFIGTAFAFLIFLASTVIAVLPKGPMSFSKDTEQLISTVIYQGWGFFSKNPREPMLNAIPLDNEEEITWPNNRAKNFFGLKRIGRSQGIELGALISDIPKEKFQKCNGNTKECAENIKTEDIIIVENKNPRPELCGLWAVSFEEQVPWSWGDAKVEMPSEVVKVEVVCSIN
ncbi:SdpA family antimicrobial peptide system protein [Bacillus sp. AGMB 02131]|uniref:SdpA family antimicrobial peptide system protein n=1 Tax=Peribacillus faecalis TaxID=2772559 RepID=A0A927CW02_9BACI|nr:SdpA family antimicrobial peptide system protein [Peribacillus faecalis]MBD3108813.1 SdpA family antimicrobial peptide system protein [Peribacillus faecalis]